MAKARETDWEAKVARAIGVGHVGWHNSRVSDTGIRGELTVPCARGHDVVVPMPTKFPHDVVKKKLQHAGWEFIRSKPVCPDCAANDREAKDNARNAADATQVTPATPETEKETPTMMSSSTAIAAATAANDQTPSAKAKAARRQVMQWLEECFELTGPEVGRYKPSFSDQTIAKETGCSVEAVAKIREEFYGKLDRPRELDALMVDVRNLAAAAATIEADAKEAAEKLIREANAAAKVIRDKATALQDRFNRLAAAQGWTA